MILVVYVYIYIYIHTIIQGSFDLAVVELLSIEKDMVDRNGARKRDKWGQH